MEQARILIAHSALIAGGVCVLLYIIDFAVTVLAKRRAVKAGADAADDVASLNNKSILGVADLGALVEALAKLAEGLSKVGPGVTSMIGAVLFFAIAAVGAGALQDSAATEQPEIGASEGGAAPAGSGNMPSVNRKLPPPSAR